MSSACRTKTILREAEFVLPDTDQLLAEFRRADRHSDDRARTRAFEFWLVRRWSPTATSTVALKVRTQSDNLGCVGIVLRSGRTKCCAEQIRHEHNLRLSWSVVAALSCCLNSVGLSTRHVRSVVRIL